MTDTNRCSVEQLQGLNNGSGNGQLLALTEWGIVTLWTVMMLPGTTPSTDVGLRTGSCVCLVLTATLGAGTTSNPYLNHLAVDTASQLCMELGRQAAALTTPPNSSDQFLVGMDSGQIMRGSLYGEALLPKVSDGMHTLGSARYVQCRSE